MRSSRARSIVVTPVWRTRYTGEIQYISVQQRLQVDLGRETDISREGAICRSLVALSLSGFEIALDQPPSWLTCEAIRQMAALCRLRVKCEEVGTSSIS